MSYSPPLFLFSPHLETIFPALFRKVRFRSPRTERIHTPDEDFLDLDKYEQKSTRCVIISHGLEGNSQRAYVRGMARAFFQKGVDVIAWTYRGCGKEMNRQLRFYHSGATDDLGTVINHAADQYEEIYLVGFSLGGNITLKYLGEPGVNSKVRKATVFSVPLDLHMSCLKISRPSNWIYSRRFLRSLKKKISSKAAVRNDLDPSSLNQVKNLFEFDDLYTGPLHGFRDAIDYYTKSSSISYIENIRVPVLVVNALNDPFLSPECYPARRFKGHSYLNFEFPEKGGHVGFTLFNRNGLYWSEQRALAFLGF